MSRLIQLDLSTKAPAPKTLVLSTWFLRYLQSNGITGGLPNDFLTNAPGALLIYDELLCDRDAFEAEADAAKRGGWITDELFVRLKEAGILRTQDFKELLPDGFLHRPEIAGMEKTALVLMEKSLARMKRGADKRGRQAARLAPELTRINEHFFQMGLQTQGLKYNWQENL